MAGKSILWEITTILDELYCKFSKNDRIKILSVDFCFIVQLAIFMIKSVNADQMIFLLYTKNQQKININFYSNKERCALGFEYICIKNQGRSKISSE